MKTSAKYKEDWRSLLKPLETSEDSKESIALAKGKEIKRSKEEATEIVTSYIEYFTAGFKDKTISEQLIEDYNKETFW